MIIFSYDGLAFRNHADSNNDHRWTSLANHDGSPLIVGGSSPNKKVETYDISTNKWTEVADYPYHDQYVFIVNVSIVKNSSVFTDMLPLPQLKVL